VTAASAHRPRKWASPASGFRRLLGWHDQILLCRHEKPGKEYWLLPGGGVDVGESLTDALHRELDEELGIDDDVPVEGPCASSTRSRRAHALDEDVGTCLPRLTGSLWTRCFSEDAAVRGHRSSRHDLDSSSDPPIQRFLPGGVRATRSRTSARSGSPRCSS
jgi:8-oxo-dGTP pyrophosphatase MutT (NUDIX family)